MATNEGPWILWEGWVPWTSHHEGGDGNYSARLHRAWCRIVINHHSELRFYERYRMEDIEAGDEISKDANLPIGDMYSWMLCANIGELEILRIAETALRELFAQFQQGAAKPVPCDHAGLQDQMVILEKEAAVLRNDLSQAESRGRRRANAPPASIASIIKATKDWPQAIEDSLREHGPQGLETLAHNVGCSWPTAKKYAQQLVKQGTAIETKYNHFALALPEPVNLPPPLITAKGDAAPTPHDTTTAAADEIKLIIDKTAPLEERIIAALGKLGPQKFERLCGMLIASTNNMSLAVAGLIKSGKICKTIDQAYGLAGHEDDDARD